MFTLLTTVISFLSGGVPKLLDFFQDKSDKKHELELAQLQTSREIELKKAGLEVEERIAHIQTEQVQITSDVTERQALYAHDIAIGQGASQWVINARAMVRPAVTYGMFILFAFVEIFGFVYAWKSGVAFDIALDNLWDADTQIIWASIVSFWFGSQAFSKK
jgi:hypothetical protein